MERSIIFCSLRIDWNWKKGNVKMLILSPNFVTSTLSAYQTKIQTLKNAIKDCYQQQQQQQQKERYF